MRLFIVSALAAAIAVAVFAVPASADFQSHFSVIAKTDSSHGTPDGFVFRDNLFNPRNRHDYVGHDKVRCHRAKIACKAHFDLHGDGRHGSLNARGDFGRNDAKLIVVGGKGDFNGVAGKIIVHSSRGRSARLSFHLVK